jgi:hypothetical protein
LKNGGPHYEDRIRALPFIFATFKVFENAWFQQRQDTLVHSDVLPSAGREDMVADAASSFCRGFSKLP